MSSLAIILAGSACASPPTCCALTSEQFVLAVRIAERCDDEDLEIITELACAGCSPQPPAPVLPPGGGGARPVPTLPPGTSPFGGDVIPPMPGPVPPIPARPAPVPTPVVNPPEVRPPRTADEDPDIFGSAASPRPSPPVDSEPTEAATRVGAPPAPPPDLESLPSAPFVLSYPEKIVPSGSSRRKPRGRPGVLSGGKRLIESLAPEAEPLPPLRKDGSCADIVRDWASQQKPALRYLYRDMASAALALQSDANVNDIAGVYNGMFGRKVGITVDRPAPDDATLNAGIAARQIVFGGAGMIASFLQPVYPAKLPASVGAAAARLIIGSSDDGAVLADAYTVHAGLWYMKVAARALTLTAPGSYTDDELDEGVTTSGVWVHQACGRQTRDANLISSCPLTGAPSLLDVMTRNYAASSGGGSFDIIHPDTKALAEAYDDIVPSEVIECLTASGLNVRRDQDFANSLPQFTSGSFNPLGLMRLGDAAFGYSYTHSVFDVPWSVQAAALDASLASDALRRPWCFALSGASGWRVLNRNLLLSLR